MNETYKTKLYRKKQIQDFPINLRKVTQSITKADNTFCICYLLKLLEEYFLKHTELFIDFIGKSLIEQQCSWLHIILGPHTLQRQKAQNRSAEDAEEYACYDQLAVLPAWLLSSKHFPLVLRIFQICWEKF